MACENCELCRDCAANRDRLAAELSEAKVPPDVADDVRWLCGRSFDPEADSKEATERAVRVIRWVEGLLPTESR